MATERQRDQWRDAATRRKVRDLHRSHGLGHYAVGKPIGHGFGPVTLDARSEYFVGCLRESANTAEISAMTQLCRIVLPQTKPLIFRTFSRNKLVHDCIHSYMDVVLIAFFAFKKCRTAVECVAISPFLGPRYRYR
eukprot:COSAG01_NODE_2573_length_7434_cov_7.930207_8_plen_136_part_00